MLFDIIFEQIKEYPKLHAAYQDMIRKGFYITHINICTFPKRELDFSSIEVLMGNIMLKEDIKKLRGV